MERNKSNNVEAGFICNISEARICQVFAEICCKYGLTKKDEITYKLFTQYWHFRSAAGFLNIKEQHKKQVNTLQNAALLLMLKRSLDIQDSQEDKPIQRDKIQPVLSVRLGKGQPVAITDFGIKYRLYQAVLEKMDVVYYWKIGLLEKNPFEGLPEKKQVVLPAVPADPGETEHYQVTDADLQRIIEFEKAQLHEDKVFEGNGSANLPFLGMQAKTALEGCSDVLKMVPTAQDRCCLVGDLMQAAGLLAACHYSISFKWMEFDKAEAEAARITGKAKHSESRASKAREVENWKNSFYKACDKLNESQRQDAARKVKGENNPSGLFDSERSIRTCWETTCIFFPES